MSTEIDKKIRKGLPPRHDTTSFQMLAPVVIPAGILLRAIGDDKFAAPISLNGVGGELTITVKPGAVLPQGSLKRVIAS